MKDRLSILMLTIIGVLGFGFYWFTKGNAVVKDIALLILCGACIIGILWSLLHIFIASDLKPIKKTIKEHGWQENEVEEDLMNGHIV